MFLSTCEIMSTIIGALAGSIASSRVKMDLFGVIVCGTLAALGGGTVRDILLDIPVYWTLPSGEIFVLASVVTSLATFYVAQKYPPPMGTIRVADAIVLALFGMIGTEKSYLHGYTPTVSVMMGICTGVAGGLLRDVLTGNVPYVFRPGELYATAALLGGVAYAVLYYAGIDSSTCFVTGFMVTLSVRLAAIRWNWNLPSYIPLFTSDTDSPLKSRKLDRRECFREALRASAPAAAKGSSRREGGENCRGRFRNIMKGQHQGVVCVDSRAVLAPQVQGSIRFMIINVPFFQTLSVVGVCDVQGFGHAGSVVNLNSPAGNGMTRT